MAKRETRTVAIRARQGDKPGVTLQAFRSGVVDDYGSLWQSDAADEFLAKRLPTLVWAHDWSEPLGPAVGFRKTPEGPEVDFDFSDFGAVPQARRAHVQVADGTIRDCSVGFMVPKGGRRDPTDEEVEQYPGVREVILRADIDEVSLVLRGAVPGAKVLAIRSGRSVDLDALVEIARRKVAGELSDEEAKAALELLGADEGASDPGQSDEGSETGSDEGEGGEEPPPDPIADIDAALASIGRSASR